MVKASTLTVVETYCVNFGYLSLRILRLSTSRGFLFFSRGSSTLRCCFLFWRRSCRFAKSLGIFFHPFLRFSRCPLCPAAIFLVDLFKLSNDFGRNRLVSA